MKNVKNTTLAKDMAIGGTAAVLGTAIGGAAVGVAVGGAYATARARDYVKSI